MSSSGVIDVAEAAEHTAELIDVYDEVIDIELLYTYFSLPAEDYIVAYFNTGISSYAHSGIAFSLRGMSILTPLSSVVFMQWNELIQQNISRTLSGVKFQTYYYPILSNEKRAITHQLCLDIISFFEKHQEL